NGELDAYPHGQDGQGQLVLSANGVVTGLFQRENWRHADPGVRVSWDRFLAFGGTWRWDGQQLSYAIAYASEPKWIGTTMLRNVPCERKRMIRETPEHLNRRGDKLVNRLFWLKGEAPDVSGPAA